MNINTAPTSHMLETFRRIIDLSEIDADTLDLALTALSDIRAHAQAAIARTVHEELQ